MEVVNSSQLPADLRVCTLGYRLPGGCGLEAAVGADCPPVPRAWASSTLNKSLLLLLREKCTPAAAARLDSLMHSRLQQQWGIVAGLREEAGCVYRYLRWHLHPLILGPSEQSTGGACAVGVLESLDGPSPHAAVYNMLQAGVPISHPFLQVR